ncbi:MAG: YjiH family protein [Candidatus Endonucleobacter sp. (ex Gigantidas childressi)]|nr:YjiH family protein [Candidatus Endonucleobacter sp. (ex Gigantidas childressi)]
MFLFVTPVSYGGNLSIPIAILSGAVQSILGEYLPTIITAIVVTASIVTVVVKLARPAFVNNSNFLIGLFDVSPLWCVIRVFGAVFIVQSYFQIGSLAVWSEETGGMMLNDLLPVLFSIFIVAGLLLPLVMRFGLLELVGTLFTSVMRPVFNLPGRSAVDCVVSWLGDGSVGILMTNKQYELGFYTQREAAVIGTTFSTVSLTFSFVILAQVGLQHLFPLFFLTIFLASIVAAIIVPRLPPLSWKKDIFINGQERSIKEDIVPEGWTSFSLGMQRALEKAEGVDSVVDIIKDGVKSAIDMVCGVIPVVMGIGTIALIIAKYTPIFTYLGMPFVPLLELLHIPQATQASTTLVVGFADMFVPSILASSIQSEMTRFVIAALSLTQLIYLSEIGALLLSSKVPIFIWELFVIFILRTLVTLPVIAGMAHLVF